MERNDNDDMAEAIFETTRGNWYLSNYKIEEEYRNKYEALIINYQKKIEKGTFDEQEAKKGIMNLLVNPIAREIQNCSKSGKYGKDFYMNSIPKEVREQAVNLIYDEIMDRIKYMQKNTDSDGKNPRLTIVWTDPNKTHQKVVDIDQIKGNYMYIRPEQDVNDIGEKGYSHLSEIEGTIREIHQDWEANVYKDKEKTAHIMYLRLRKLGLIVRNNEKGELKDWDNKSKAIDMINAEIKLFNDPKSKPILNKGNFIGLKPIEPIISERKAIEVPADSVLNEDTFIKKEKVQLKNIIKAVEKAFYNEDFEKIQTLYDEFIRRKKDLDDLGVKLPDSLMKANLEFHLNHTIDSLEIKLMIEDLLKTNIEFKSFFDTSSDLDNSVTKTLYFKSESGISLDIFKIIKNSIIEYGYEFDCIYLQNPKGKDICSFRRDLKNVMRYYNRTTIFDDMELLNDLIEDETQASKEYKHISLQDSPYKYEITKLIQEMFKEMAMDEAKHRESLKYLKDFMNNIKKNPNEYFDVKEFLLGYFYQE